MFAPQGQAPDHEQKRAALGYLHEAWQEARIDGIDGDCLAQACLFAAFAEFVPVPILPFRGDPVLLPYGMSQASFTAPIHVFRIATFRSR